MYRYRTKIVKGGIFDKYNILREILKATKIVKGELLDNYNIHREIWKASFSF